MDLLLGKIADILGVSWTSDRSIPIQGVSIDSRTLKKGMLFFALRGERSDGHHFIEEVFQKGACGAVVSREWFSVHSEDKKGSFFPVEDPLIALQEVAAHYRKTFHCPIVAVAGSNGKTTTKEMIAKVLESQYRVMKSSGSYNNHIGVPLSICAWERSGEVAVIEVGANHFGEIRRLCGIARPTHGVITNIGKGHIEFFHDLHGVARAKGELLEFLSDSGEAFLNGDDPYLLTLKTVVDKTMTYGFSEGCNLRARKRGFDRHGYPKMIAEGETVKISVPGQFNLYNGLAAAAVGRSFSIPWEDIREALESYRSIEKRMEALSHSGVSILNDAYNANPSSVQQALMSLLDMKNAKRRVVVLGDMLELGKSSNGEHRNVGEWVKEMGIDAFFSCGAKMKIAADRAKELGLDRAYHFDSKQALIDGLKNFIKEGDVVLVKGSRSMHMEEIVDGLIGDKS